MAQLRKGLGQLSRRFLPDADMIDQRLTRTLRRILWQLETRELERRDALLRLRLMAAGWKPRHEGAQLANVLGVLDELPCKIIRHRTGGHRCGRLVLP